MGPDSGSVGEAEVWKEPTSSYGTLPTKEVNILCQEQADAGRKGSGAHQPFRTAAKGLKPSPRPAGRAGSGQPPGALHRWILEGDGGAVGDPGWGFSGSPLAAPAGVLVAPPGQGQLQVQLLQILALQARAQLPGGVLLVRLRAKGPVCGRSC